MTEAMWRHLFVQELVTIIRREVGLGRDMAFRLAFEEVDAFWRDFARYTSPEAAAAEAFQKLKK